MKQTHSYPTLFTLLLSVLLIMPPFRAQTGTAQPAAIPGPHAIITINVNGKPVDEKTGASVSTQKIDFVATLDPVSRQQYPDLQDAVIKSAWISLARGSQRVGSIYWKAGETLDKLARQAKPGDRYVIEFDLAARRKNGKLVPIAERPVYNIPLR